MSLLTRVQGQLVPGAMGNLQDLMSGRTAGNVANQVNQQLSGYDPMASSSVQNIMAAAKRQGEAQLGDTLTQQLAGMGLGGAGDSDIARLVAHERENLGANLQTTAANAGMSQLQQQQNFLQSLFPSMASQGSQAALAIPGMVQGSAAAGTGAMQNLYNTYQETANKPLQYALQLFGMAPYTTPSYAVGQNVVTQQQSSNPINTLLPLLQLFGGA